MNWKGTRSNVPPKSCTWRNPALVWCWQDSRGWHTIWSQSVCNKISNTFITFIWPIDVFEKTRQVTRALEVLVGVMLVNVHLHLVLQHELHREALKCTVFSYSCIECSKYLVWHQCADNISTNGSPDYFHRFSSNEIRAYEIEQEYLSAVQDPEPL